MWPLAEVFVVLATILCICRLFGCLPFIRRAFHSRKSRQLGKFDEYCEILSNDRQGTTNSCYVLVLHSKAALKHSLVSNALLWLAKRQPMLRATIKTVSNPFWFHENKESYFKIIEPNKIGDMIELIKSDIKASQWQKSWYDIALNPTKQPLLWQAVMFTEEFLSDTKNHVNTMVFRVNHCIIDGVSGMQLCKQFLCFLNSNSDNGQVIHEDVQTLELLPSFHELISQTRSKSVWEYSQEFLGLHVVYKLVKRLKFCFMLACKPDKPYPFFTTEPSPECRDLLYRVFSEAQTSQIRRVCRSKGVTVTGALSAAAHLAFCELVRSQRIDIDSQQQLSHLFAIDGRRVCAPKPSEQYLGNFFLSKLLRLPFCNSSDFWSIAQEATEKIHAVIKERKYLAAQLRQWDIFSPRELVDVFHSPPNPKKILKLFTQNYISSAGAFNIEDSNGIYNLHECMYYSLPFGFTSFSSHYNTTVNRKMSWVIMSSKFVPRAVEQQFATLCFDIIQRETQEG